MAGVKGSGKEMYAETASSATQTALAVITRICSRLPVTASDGCKFSLISFIDVFLLDIDHFSPMDWGFEHHMELIRLSQPSQQALPQQQSRYHRMLSLMDGIGIPGSLGKSAHFFRGKGSPGYVPFRNKGFSFL